jgi:hypothetical protein
MAYVGICLGRIGRLTDLCGWHPLTLASTKKVIALHTLYVLVLVLTTGPLS